MFKIFTRRVSRAELAPDVLQALSMLRTQLLGQQQLRLAVSVALAEEANFEDAARAYCEDYGLDQVDPIKRADILKHALTAAERA
jgi:hypothetical protein